MTATSTQREEPRLSHNDINLGTLDDAFSHGGNRLCFVHPHNSNQIIKVARPDRLAHIKRREKSFPKNLKPLSVFDDNLQESEVYQRITRWIGPQAFELIPPCHGFVATNLGPGLCSDLIRDDSGAISLTLKQFLWINGNTAELQKAVQHFTRRWSELGMPSRNLLLHNIVVQCEEGIPLRLFVIDGLGWPDLIPLGYVCKPLAKRKAARKATQLYLAIEALLQKKADNSHYGYHGWLNEESRSG